MRKRGRGVQPALAGLLSGMLCLASPVQAGEMSMSDFLSAVGDVEVPAQVAAPQAAPAGTVQPLPRIPSRPMVGEGPRPEGSPSGAGLRAENRRLQAALERLQTQNTTLHRELTARGQKSDVRSGSRRYCAARPAGTAVCTPGGGAGAGTGKTDCG